MLTRPQDGEFLSYYQVYIDKVPEGDLLDLLQQQAKQVILELADISDEQGKFRYDEGKWSLKEVLGHITDTERIMSYRLLRIARGDTTPLPSFEETLFVSNAHFDGHTVAELLQDFSAVRESTLTLIRQLEDADWLRLGTASEGPISTRAIAYIIYGHTLHHLKIIRERYLNV
ncbi:DinB family protein [Paenibacillus anaericanus]|uniref:DinB family protein n=1 Tax=Paenibacillus anaericanus TaxID=170367 RepID=A0A3S1EL43_9BACL|nr:DinB family protein [Paenibacillus anaericanus]RUT47893.1 DinB family protein [Paenibacillus anaericanus]